MPDKIRLTITKGTLYPYHVYWSGFGSPWERYPEEIRECLLLSIHILSISTVREQLEILRKYYPDKINIPFEQMLQLEKWEEEENERKTSSK